MSPDILGYVMVTTAIVVVSLLLLSWGAFFVLGPKNDIDEGIEEITEEVIEDELKLPKDSLKPELDAIMPKTQD